MTISRQEGRTNGVTTLQRSNAFRRLAVPDLKRALTGTSDQLVVRTHGQRAHIGTMPREVERVQFIRQCRSRFRRGRRWQVIDLEGII